MVVARLMQCALVVLTIAGWPDPAGAESRALLIGVSDYDDSIGLTDLRGPANDVRLLRDVLTARGVERIQILADGVDGAARPTRAAILDAFDRLAAEVGSGDFVYIHLSGHGTRQPDRNGDETDGLDEVFLPADTARAEPGAGAIPNAIVDEELGNAVDRIRDAGADVWLVMDSCYSGTGLRAVTADTATRFVDPEILGIRATPAAEPVGTAPLALAGAATRVGKYLAFYAAQSSEVAREVNLKSGDVVDDGTGWYGLFTAKLASRLSDDSVLSYRQLFQAVLRDMTDDAIPGVARLQTPLWEGDLIDAAVLGGRETVGVRQFSVSGSRVSAGLVHGMGRGTLVALVGDAAAGPDDVIGYAQLTDVEATEAALRPVSAACVPDSEVLCENAGALPEGARYARVVARPIDLTLRLAHPRDLRTGVPLAEESSAMQSLRNAVAAVNETGLARVEVGSADFSIDVALDGGTLWFGHLVSIGNTPVGLSWGPDDGDLAPLLRRMARAEQLAAMLRSVSEAESISRPGVSPIRWYQ